PCVQCNGGFRFAELLAFARRVGAPRLATGHYARIVEHDGKKLLARAADDAKDQSYMLARLDPRHLDRIWFPLGDQVKAETRAEAAEAGLPVAQKAESQEACFLAGDDYRSFLGRHGLQPAAGAIVDEAGDVLGEHDGFWRFTPGQRRGLGVSAAEPLYALSTDARTNTVVAGPRSSLARSRVMVRGRLFAPAVNVSAKLRYRSPALPATVEATAHGFELQLDSPAYGVARGQAAVLYDGDVVVGSGLVTDSRSD
ncbi:MAG: bifunctional Fe-S cluster assembly protein NifU/tRNA 2-thiouridine(34) synthase MnmA, partial [Actinobacteria bacterium]|nr:bifunctional Fe-S cluster assembly protein NifU/tRNA 2-thiouridine(34) synthase MnmA [Actinomycetota bacterium]